MSASITASRSGFDSAPAPERDDWAFGRTAPRRATRWFLGISLLIIAINSLVLAAALSSYLSERMLTRDSVVSMQFVNSIVRVQNAAEYFHGDTMNAKAPEIEEIFRHVAGLPDVLHANVYGADRSVLWSSNPTLIGKRFPDNDELERAFRGELAPQVETYERGRKMEHAYFPEGITRFIEHYLPIWGVERDVIGAVEVYKSPEQLLQSIRHAQNYVWIGSLIGAAVLYSGLILVTLYARRILRLQEARTVEAERLAVVGEMASAVAHGLRNPLAAIRSCAELVLDDDIPDESRRFVEDIIGQSDRLESWIRSFLIRTRVAGDDEKPLAAVDEVLRDCLNGFRPQMASRGIDADFEPEGAGPLVRVPASELAQIVNSVLANGIEAIERDGRILIERHANDDGTISVVIRDTGPGMPPDVLSSAFEPFATTKPSGLGIGLALVRRILERVGGTMELRNRDDRGAEVTLRLPEAR